MVNITNVILKNLGSSFVLDVPGLNVLQYYINNDLDCLLGNHVFSEENMVDIIKAKTNHGFNLSVETIYNEKPLLVSVYLDDKDFKIVGRMNIEEVFTISGNNEKISNKVKFDDDIYKIEENYTVGFSDYDAVAFRLAHKENDELLYDGSLISIGSKIGDKTYFDYKDNMPVKVEESRKPEKATKKTLLGFFKNLFTGSPTMGVKTNRSDWELFAYSDEIFSSLRNRLEVEYPRKKDPNVVVKVKKDK